MPAAHREACVKFSSPGEVGFKVQAHVINYMSKDYDADDDWYWIWKYLLK